MMIDVMSTAQSARGVSTSGQSVQSDVSGASAASIDRLRAFAEHHRTMLEGLQNLTDEQVVDRISVFLS